MNVVSYKIALFESICTSFTRVNAVDQVKFPKVGYGIEHQVTVVRRVRMREIRSLLLGNTLLLKTQHNIDSMELNTVFFVATIRLTTLFITYTGDYNTLC